MDINPEYLAEAAARYPSLREVFKPVVADLLDDEITLPNADLVIANLLVEYIGTDCFQRAIRVTGPGYVSCVIQINADETFVSESPYSSAFRRLTEIFHHLDKTRMDNTMEAIGYTLVHQDMTPLPNGKRFQRLDYRSED